MKIYSIAIIFFIGLTFSTCSYDLSTPDVCFQEDILPIFISNCTMADCHNSSNEEEVDLTTYEGIMKEVTPKHPQLSEVYTTIAGKNPSMPQGPTKLTAKQVNYIKVWIRMGAKNTSNCSVCDTTNFSYSGKIRPLLDNWCVGCHSGAAPGGGYNFSTYNGVLGAVSNTKLLGSVQHSTGYKPMPKNSQLPTCDINAIEKWINAGALNN